MLQRVFTPKTLVCLTVCSAVILSLALLRSEDFYPDEGDEGRQSEDAQSRRSTFLVDTPGCKIPNIDPFDSSVRHLVAADNVSIICNSTPPMTYVMYT